MYNTEGFEQWFKINKDFTSPVHEWHKATSDMCQRIAQQNLEIIGENFSRFSDQFKRLSNVRRPEDLLALQKDCMSENASAAMENMQKIMHLTMENLNEIGRLCAPLRDSVNATIKKATEKASKIHD